MEKLKAEKWRLEVIQLCGVGSTFNDKHKPNFDRKKCNCKELAFEVDSLKIETHPEAESHFVNDRLMCYFKH